MPPALISHLDYTAATLHFRTGRLARADRMLSRLLSSSDAQSDPAARAVYLGARIDVLHAMGRSEEAFRQATRGLSMLQSLSLPSRRMADLARRREEQRRQLLRRIDVVCSQVARPMPDDLEGEFHEIRSALRRGEVMLAQVGTTWMSADSAGLSTGVPSDDDTSIHHIFVVSPPEPALRVAGPPPISLAVTATRTVSYLPHPGMLVDLRRGRCRASGGTTIVADPMRDLPHAKRSGRRLRKRDPSATLIEGEAATRQAFRAVLQTTGLLFFEGHGRIIERGGHHLALALHDGPATPHDVLLAGQVPDIAILLGCTTGRADGWSAEPFGWVDALLANGSRAVVASGRAIDDADAAALAFELAEAMDALPLGQALGRALERNGTSVAVQLWGLPECVPDG